MTERPDLGAILDPRTIAIVGAREGSTVAESAVRAFESPAQVFLVNPKHASAFGRDTVPDLRSIGRPVDVVLCLTGAAASVDAAQAAPAGAAGGLEGRPPRTAARARPATAWRLIHVQGPRLRPTTLAGG